MSLTSAPSTWCATSKRCGGIIVLVNNAGIASMNILLLTLPSTVERIFSTNVRTPLGHARGGQGHVGGPPDGS
jgi:NAD(P)-dependent dehydrogenase (short-subunit alcohol dehydrogenase family)